MRRASLHKGNRNASIKKQTLWHILSDKAGIVPQSMFFQVLVPLEVSLACVKWNPGSQNPGRRSFPRELQVRGSRCMDYKTKNCHPKQLPILQGAVSCPSDCWHWLYNNMPVSHWTVRQQLLQVSLQILDFICFLWERGRDRERKVSLDRVYRNCQLTHRDLDT